MFWTLFWTKWPTVLDPCWPNRRWTAPCWSMCPTMLFPCWELEKHVGSYDQPWRTHLDHIGGGGTGWTHVGGRGTCWTHLGHVGGRGTCWITWPTMLDPCWPRRRWKTMLDYLANPVGPTLTTSTNVSGKCESGYCHHPQSFRGSTRFFMPDFLLLFSSFVGPDRI